MVLDHVSAKHRLYHCILCRTFLHCGFAKNVDKFWEDFDKAVHNLAPINKELLKKRDQIQKKIDEWHLSKKGAAFDKDQYFNFLKSILILSTSA